MRADAARVIPGIDDIYGHGSLQFPKSRAGTFSQISRVAVVSPLASSLLILRHFQYVTWIFLGKYRFTRLRYARQRLAKRPSGAR